jgi:hypothetical protein
VSIGDNAFFGCTLLYEVHLGANLEYIGRNAFRACSSLLSVTLPTTLLEIGDNAFYGCERLVEIYDLTDDFDVTVGEIRDGYVGAYALVVHTEASAESILAEEGDFVMMHHDGTRYFLLAIGTLGESRLPAGEDYVIYRP